MKTIEQHFCDWEANTFGYGYGSGEEHVLGALKEFLSNVPPDNGYDYKVLETAVTPTITWLLINTLGHDDKIEYGTSPRYAWLTKSGLALKDFLASRPLDAVVAATDHGDDYIYCAPDFCNCEDGDCRPHNPFWERHWR